MDEPALRADALRNRRRILDAAAAAFAEGGLDVGVAEIARRAGVGAGTIFRRFPCKEDLVAAIIEERIAQLEAVAEEALESDDPGEAFRRFVIAGTELQVRDRGFFDAVAAGQVTVDPRLHEAHERLLAFSAKLLDRAQAAGEVRADLTGADVPILMCAAAATPAKLLATQPEIWRRYVTLVLDGVRPGATSPLEEGPPDFKLEKLSSSAARPG